MITKTEANELWDAAAPWWAQHLRTDPNRSSQVIPTMLDLLGNPAGRRILDAGCGEGTLARLLAKAGGIVTGVDFSNVLASALELERNDRIGIEYQRLDIADAEAHFSANHFDAATCSLVLHACPYVQAVLSSLRKLLRRGGELIVCELNPKYVTPYSPWFHEWEPTSTPPDGSFRVRIAPDAPLVPYFYRRADELLKTFEVSGFRLTRSLEPEAPSYLAAPPGQGLFVFWCFQVV